MQCKEKIVKRLAFKGIICFSLLLVVLLAPIFILEAKVDDKLVKKNPLDLEYYYKGEKIDFNMDVFYYKTAVEDEYNVEIWYEILDKNLVFEAPKDSSSKFKLETHLVLAINLFSNGKKIEDKSNLWSVKFGIEDEKDAKNPDKSVMGNLTMTLKAGTYVAKLGVTDASSLKIGINKVKFEIPAFDKTKIFMSSIKFASKMEDAEKKSSEDDIYYVENMKKRIFPNVAKKFKTEADFGIFYEIYNLKVDAKDKPKFEITYFFNRIDKPAKEGDPIVTHKVYKKTIPSLENAEGNNSPQAYMFKLFKEMEDPKTKKIRPLFIPGNYEMIVDIVDKNRNEAEMEKGLKFDFIIEGK
jgi:hypothetical protein